MSLAPTIGGSVWLAENIKPPWGKKSCQAYASMQKPGCAGKNSSWFVTFSTYMMVCMGYKRKCLWRGRLLSSLCSVVTCTIYCFYISLQSQDNDFHPHETLIVQSYEICDSPWITVIQTPLSGIITYMHYASAFTNHVTITLWEGVVRSVQCCLWSPISCVCVQEQGCRTSAPFFITASLH